MKPTDLVKQNLTNLLSELPEYVLYALDLYDGLVICPNGTIGLEWLVDVNKLWVEIGEDSMTIMFRRSAEGVNCYDCKDNCLISYNTLEHYFHLLGLKNG
jgi:hypothetical protein